MKRILFYWEKVETQFSFYVFGEKEIINPV